MEELKRILPFKRDNVSERAAAIQRDADRKERTDREIDMALHEAEMAKHLGEINILRAKLGKRALTVIEVEDERH